MVIHLYVIILSRPRDTGPSVFHLLATILDVNHVTPFGFILAQAGVELTFSLPLGVRSSVIVHRR